MVFFKDFLINDCGASKLVRKESIITPSKVSEVQEETIPKPSKKIEVVPEEKPSNTTSLSDKYLDVMKNDDINGAKDVKLANEMTKKGNLAFQEKKFKEAGLHYGKSIECSNGESAITFIKRAECLAMLNKPLSVRRDCDAAIRINPEAGKAYRLRAKAYLAMGKLAQAKDDLEKSRRFEDDSSEADRLLEEIKSKMNTEKTSNMNTKPTASATTSSPTSNPNVPSK